MSKKTTDDGGPAFPNTIRRDDDEGLLIPREYGLGGMSLRDWFAGQVLAQEFSGGYAGGHERVLLMAAHAYRVADAMLAERSRRG